MKTSNKQISLFGEDASMSSAEGSLASPTHKPEKDAVQKILETSGRKCVERFGRFSQNGLWSRMFSASLIGMTGWYSTRCRLKWSLKGTKSKRMYFQLVVSVPSTEETGSSSLDTDYLLKTPCDMDAHVTSGKANPVSGDSGTLAQEIMSGYPPTMRKLGLIPTPNTMDDLPPKEGKAMQRLADGPRKGRSAPSNLREYVNPDSWTPYLLPTPSAIDRDIPTPEQIADRQKKYGGQVRAMYLHHFAAMGLLPTPVESCHKGGVSRPTEKRQNDTLAHSVHGVMGEHGKTSQLNPLFVEEMMGFPNGWTELPFLSGEENQSRDTEML